MKRDIRKEFEQQRHEFLMTVPASVYQKKREKKKKKKKSINEILLGLTD